MSDTSAADFDPVSYLQGKGFQGKQGSTGEWSFPCFMDCGEQPGSRKRKLYVNTRTGMFWCHVCNAKGGTYVLQQHFGDVVAPGTKDPISERALILEQATELGQAMLEQNDDLMLYLLNERGLTPEQVIERRLGYVGNRWSLVSGIKAKSEDLLESGLVYNEGSRKGQDFFYDHLLIPYIENGRVVQMRGRALGGKATGRYMTGPGERVRLFNADVAERVDNLIVVEGEFDAIRLAQELAMSPRDDVRKNYGVVGLPGANAIPEDFDAIMSKVKRVFIALDADDVGRAAAVKIKDRLGARSRVVELPGDDVDWSDLLNGGWTWRDAMDAIGDAPGKRIFSVAEAGAAFRRSRHELGEGLQTGFTAFDALVKPGLVPGQLMVTLAKTGTGKTIWLCNLAHNMRDVPALFVSLEQTREEVYERFARIHRFHDPRASDRDIDAAYDKVAICDINRMGEEELGSLLEEYEVEKGERPQVVYVDYLGYFARGVRGNSPYEKTSNAVMALKAMAKAARVVMVAPHQVSRSAKVGQAIDIDDARDAGVVEETADFLLSIYRPEDAQIDTDGDKAPNGKLRMGVLKSRHGGKDRVLPLQMDLLTLAMVEDIPGAAATKAAAHHTYLYSRGYDYEQLRLEQTQPVQMGMTA